LTLWLDHGHGGAGAVPPVFWGQLFWVENSPIFFLKMTGKFQTILDIIFLEKPNYSQLLMGK